MQSVERRCDRTESRVGVQDGFLETRRRQTGAADVRGGQAKALEFAVRVLMKFLFILLLFCQLAMAQQPEPSSVMIPTKENLHLYLLMGQSNMAGSQGGLPSKKPTPEPRILALNQSNEWAVATDPLHFDAPNRGAGPGMSFAKAMLLAEKDSAVVIGLIPCAEGGTKLELWEKSGRLFTNAVARARTAMEKGTLKGVLWHQGESDSDSETNAKTYGVRLGQMIREFRQALGVPDLPFVAGKLCEAFEQHGTYPHAKIVNQALDNLPKQVPQTACADSKGLGHRGDAIHFTTEAQVEFGKRYAGAMLKLTQPK